MLYARLLYIIGATFQLQSELSTIHRTHNDNHLLPLILSPMTAAAAS